MRAADVAAGLDEAPDDLARLVGGDAAGDADEHEWPRFLHRTVGRSGYVRSGSSQCSLPWAISSRAIVR
jgi:hypothetical protein